MESKYFTRHFSSDLMQNNIPESKNNLLNRSQFVTVAPGMQRRGCPRTNHDGPPRPPFPTPRCGYRVIFHSTRIPVSHPKPVSLRPAPSPGTSPGSIKLIHLHVQRMKPPSVRDPPHPRPAASGRVGDHPAPPGRSGRVTRLFIWHFKT